MTQKHRRDPWGTKRCVPVLSAECEWGQGRGMPGGTANSARDPRLTHPDVPARVRVGQARLQQCGGSPAHTPCPGPGQRNRGQRDDRAIWGLSS